MGVSILYVTPSPPPCPPAVTIYWTQTYARVCESGGTLLATYPTCREPDAPR